MICKHIRFLLFFFGLTMIISCGPSDGKKILKLGHGLDAQHSVHKAMIKMDEVLQQVSHGKMSIEIYPNQQLGTERECLELLQIGSLDITKVSSGVMENFSPKMKVFGLPFLFRDKQHYFDVCDGDVGRELLDEGDRYWLKGLGYYDSGSRSFYTKKTAVEKPADLSGLKIRVMESVSAIEMVNTLGGSATPISWGELYTALQQGVVDGAENNPPSFYLSRHYEVCDYYVLDEHTMLPDVLIIGTTSWNRLSDQEKKWLETAVDSSVIYQRKLWADAEKEALEAVIAAGVEVIYPDKQPFIDKVSTLYDEVAADPVMSSLVEEIKDVR